MIAAADRLGAGPYDWLILSVVATVFAVWLLNGIRNR